MAEVVRRLRNFIDGAFVDASDGPEADIVDPSTGEAIATAPDLRSRGRGRGLRLPPSTAFGAWSRTTPSERQRALLKIADALESRADEFVAVESAEHRQADRADRLRGTAAERGPTAVLRGSRPAARGSARPVNTWPGTRPTSDANRSAWSPR